MRFNNVVCGYCEMLISMGVLSMGRKFVVMRESYGEFLEVDLRMD